VARKYELKQRAERQEATRRRIAEAALELHGTIGPARTTVSAIAGRAGVQRHTFYRHFPDERSLYLACSGLYVEQDPPPDPEPWLAIDDPAERVRAALSELYAYYGRNESLLSCVSRDAAIMPVVAEVVELRFGSWRDGVRDVLLEPFPGPARRLAGALELALDFQTWWCLARSGLTREEVVETMVAAVVCQGA
jgi:AcrR family transcriptional regulator